VVSGVAELSGQPKRDWYLWSDTDTKYHACPIIFVDTEMSNWAWDPISKQYYWHRFFSHQPDLNYGNPRVRGMWQVMKFLAGHGGRRFSSRCCALSRRARGTRCENLPETHAIIKDYRRRIDLVYPEQDAAGGSKSRADGRDPYFGLGDEFHMAFHFPLMPRMFMAVKLEDRKPIIDILEQTPPIPEICSGASFLRNHDS